MTSSIAARLPLILIALLFAVSSQMFTACSQTEAEIDDTLQTSANQATLLQAIDAYDTAAEARDFEQIVRLSMPTKVLAVLMQEPNAPTDDLRVALAEMVEATQSGFASVESFDYEHDLTDLEILKTSSGLSYALFPTITNIAQTGYSVKSTGTTLAVHDDGQWFLLNPQDEESIGWFRQAYPSLESVDLQPNQMEVVR